MKINWKAVGYAVAIGAVIQIIYIAIVATIIMRTGL